MLPCATWCTASYFHSHTSSITPFSTRPSMLRRPTFPRPASTVLLRIPRLALESRHLKPCICSLALDSRPLSSLRLQQHLVRSISTDGSASCWHGEDAGLASVNIAKVLRDEDASQVVKLWLLVPASKRHLFWEMAGAETSSGICWLLWDAIVTLRVVQTSRSSYPRINSGCRPSVRRAW